MNEQNTNNPETAAGSSAQSQSGSSFDQFLSEVGELALALGHAAGKAAEDLTGLMVLPVGSELRGRMDDLVEAGLAKTRGEAALALLRDGVRSNQNVHEQVEKTRARIEALRSQLHGLIGQQS